jgi:hypothetical protein
MSIFLLVLYIDTGPEHPQRGGVWSGRKDPEVCNEHGGSLPTLSAPAALTFIGPLYNFFFMPYRSGDRPGKGRYFCLGCGKVLTLDHNTDTLPPCRLCKGDEFRKE